MNKMSKPSKILKFMKSVKPTRIWIDGKCYDISKDGKPETREANETVPPTEELCKKHDINFVEDQYVTCFGLASAYYNKLENFTAVTLQDIEEDSGAKIEIPKSDENQKICIKGGNVENVIDARAKFLTLISAIREKDIAQQFIAIPVFSDEVKKNFVSFKELILQEENVKGMCPTIFQKPERLHLTVSVFTLLDDNEKNEAIRVLEECKDKIINPTIAKTGPLRIRVQGLDCMNANYSKANVLYANAKFCSEDDEHTLQNIVNLISNHFYDRGLVCRFQENVKLHVTLLNTKYRKTKARKRKWSRIPFDASTIIEKYKDYHFGESEFDSIHLSHMSSVDVSNGFYKPLSTISFK